MQIHELTQKTVNEGWLGSAFGLDKPNVQQALGQVGGDIIDNIAARFTKDPRYTKLPLDQRIDVMRRDAALAQTIKKLQDKFNEHYKSLMYANNNQPMDDRTFAANLINWLDTNVFERKLNTLDPALRTKFDGLIAQAAKNRTNANFDSAFKELITLATVARFAPTPTAAPVKAAPVAPAGKISTPPSPGAPTPAEQARLQSLIQQKLGQNP